MIHSFLNVQNLASQRKNSLKCTVSALLGGTAGRITFDKEQFTVFGMT